MSLIRKDKAELSQQKLVLSVKGGTQGR